MNISQFNIDLSDYDKWFLEMITLRNDGSIIYIQLYEVGRTDILGIWKLESYYDNTTWHEFVLDPPLVANGKLSIEKTYTISWIATGSPGTSGSSGSSGTSGSSGSSGTSGSSGSSGSSGTSGILPVIGNDYEVVYVDSGATYGYSADSGLTYSNGILHVNGIEYRQASVEYLGSITKDPTGFKNTNLDSNLTWDEVTRTISITASPAVDIYVRGKHFGLTAWSDTIPDITDTWFWYMDETGTIIRTSTFSEDIIKSYAYIANTSWDATLGKSLYVGDERHGIGMDGSTHFELHNTTATWYFSGLSCYDFLVNQTGDLDSHAQFTVGAGVVYDEDVKHENTEVLAGTDTYRVFYREGTSWNYQDTNFPVISAPGGRAYYNSESGGTW